jgi:vancomycin resistance protein YoaR
LADTIWIEVVKKSAKILWGLFGTLLLAGGGVYGYSEFVYDPLPVPGYSLDGLALNMRKSAVGEVFEQFKVDTMGKDVALGERAFGDKTYKATVSDFGCDFNVDEEVELIVYRDFFKEILKEYDNLKIQEKPVEVNWICESGDVTALGAFVEKNHPKIGKAAAKYAGGKIQLTYEQNSMELDVAGVGQAVAAAVKNGFKGTIPLERAAKAVPDDELEKIQEVMSSFTTKFNGGQFARSANIRLAASRIDGLVLMPGETFSFNGYLGQRTTAKGFKVAGVYVSGRHDFDVGGGICQVSTTLYGAALRTRLKVDTRFPHSLPVPYVPLGQDAAVSYPNPDFKVTNSFDFPIAIAAAPEKNAITFRILGHKPIGQEIKLESKLIKSWSNGEKVIHDPSLGYGVRKVVDRGGSGRQVRTWKLVYEDGELVERIDLGLSTYRGGPRIIAVNKSARAPAPKATPPVESTPASLPGSSEG